MIITLISCGRHFFLLAHGPLQVPHDKDMITAAFSLAFNGFLHCGKLTSSIKWQDIKIDMDRQCLDAWLQWSKTEPSGKGTTITVGSSQHRPFDLPSSETDQIQTDLRVNRKRHVRVSQRSPAYETSIDYRTPNASSTLWRYQLRSLHQPFLLHCSSNICSYGWSART